MSCRQFFEDLNIGAIKQSGSELVAKCVCCDKDAKMYINADTGQWYCHYCHEKGNVRTILKKFHNLDSRQIAETLKKYGLDDSEFSLSTPTERAREKQQKIADKIGTLAWTPSRAASKEEIGDMCSTKGILPKDLGLLTSWEIGFYERPGTSDPEPRIMIPAYYDSLNVSQPTAYLQVRIDGKPFTRGEVKYPLVKNSVIGLIGVKRILKDNPPEVILTEGWRDAVAATALGYYAVASCGGASTWYNTFTELFRDKIVYIVMDADDAGQRQAMKVAPIINQVAKMVKVCQLPYQIARKSGQDLFDYCNDPKLKINATSLKDNLLDKGVIVCETRSDVLSDKLSQTVAEEFLYRQHGIAHKFHRNLWYEYNYKECKYTMVDKDDLLSNIRRMLMNLSYEKRVGEGNIIAAPFDAGGKLANYVLDCYSVFDEVRVTGKNNLLPPFWLTDNDIDPRDIICMNNCLLHVDNCSVQELRLSEDFLSTQYLPYNYDPDAKCPTWERFISEMFSNPDGSIDSETVEQVQEFIGLSLTPDMRYQKILGILGPERSGKGTLCRTVRALVGEANYVSQPLSALAMQFGLKPLLGKNVAVIPDARISGNGGDTHQAVELLKSITGEDQLTVDVKYQQPLDNVVLNTKFIVCSNGMMNLRDQSGALASRWLFVETCHSHTHDPDTTLGNRILQEIPGIFNWALEGLFRLRKRGRFVETDKSQEINDEFRMSISPVRSFISECCFVHQDGKCSTDEMYSVYVRWSEASGHRNPMTKRIFSNQIISTCASFAPYVQRDFVYSMEKNRSVRGFKGINLNMEHLYI